MTLDSGEIDSGGAGGARIIDSVSAAGETDAEFLGFVGLDGCDDAEIGGGAIGGLVGVSDKKHGVGAGGAIGASLGESGNFVGSGGFPFAAVGAVAEFGILHGGSGVGVDDGMGHEAGGKHGEMRGWRVSGVVE